MRASFRQALRIALFGWPDRQMVGYDLLPVAANWGRCGWRHLLRPYWAARRFLYMLGFNV